MGEERHEVLGRKKEPTFYKEVSIHVSLARPTDTSYTAVVI